MEKEEVRKGPWTEQEDVQLVLYVNLFGDRRWDFIAKVSGLKRTGKSCRLRWVNYLHPGLKRGKMTPHEETLVLELHSKWGNRWSRIARKLPGRTDNEIKNYWRSHMRKKAQEKKKPTAISSSSTSSSNSSSSSISNSPEKKTMEPSFHDTGRVVDLLDTEKKTTTTGANPNPGQDRVEEIYYSVDDLWKDFEYFSEETSCKLITCEASPLMSLSPSPIWDHDDHYSLHWSNMDKNIGQETNILGDDYVASFPFYNYMTG